MQFLRKKKPPEAGSFADAVDLERLPRHVAIIMDGNGRWAQKRGLPRALGHRAGAEALRAIVRTSGQLGIEALTFYAFSTENWKRTTEEVGFLMNLFVEFLEREVDELHREHVRIRIIGDMEGLPQKQRDVAQRAEERTKDNDGLNMSLAVNYGSRAEIVHAVQMIAQDVAAGKIAPEAVDQALFESHLYTKGLADVDLMIRTSGEMRLSNFLLYQCSYAEFVATDTLWPDFNVDAYLEAIRAFQSRQRQFGGR